MPVSQKAEAENCLNLGDGDVSELRSCHCAPAWATKGDSVSKKMWDLAGHGGSSL